MAAKCLLNICSRNARWFHSFIHLFIHSFIRNNSISYSVPVKREYRDTAYTILFSRDISNVIKATRPLVIANSTLQCLRSTARAFLMLINCSIKVQEHAHQFDRNVINPYLYRFLGSKMSPDLTIPISHLTFLRAWRLCWRSVPTTWLFHCES